MNKPTVTVIDYGCGNLYSVMRAFEYCGAGEIKVSSDIGDILAADRLVLPGVGAFKDGMAGLQRLGLIDPIHAYVASGKPLMGICLGMQLLATSSHEFGLTEGLGIIPGQVLPMPNERASGLFAKVPFIGWSCLSSQSDRSWHGTVLNKTRSHEAIYLVHSFHLVTDDPSHTLATYDNNGLDIVAAVRRDNVTGLQFHPEKSGEVGLNIIREFLA